jgi:hypothetical protein
MSCPHTATIGSWFLSFSAITPTLNGIYAHNWPQQPKAFGDLLNLNTSQDRCFTNNWTVATGMSWHSVLTTCLPLHSHFSGVVTNGGHLWLVGDFEFAMRDPNSSRVCINNFNLHNSCGLIDGRYQLIMLLLWCCLSWPHSMVTPG